MKHLPVFFCLALLGLIRPAGAAEGGSFLGNGDFHQKSADGLPELWQKGDEGAVELLSEESPFVRLTAQEAGQLVQVTQRAAIPAGVQGVEFQARFRTANVKFGKGFLNDARARFAFLNADGAKVGKNPRDVIFDSHARDWTEISRKFPVPEGAAFLEVVLCLNRPASGTLDVARVDLAAMKPEEAAAMAMAPKLAEQKKAADEAEAAAMAQAPARSRELKVSGTHLVAADGTRVKLQGVNVPSLGWSATGESLDQSVKVALRDWKANAIRLPVQNSLWFGRGRGKVTANDQEAYRQAVDRVIKMAAGQGAYVVLDLHRFGTPDQSVLEFWKDAAARYANNPAVLFDLFNEPGNLPWEIWRNGGEWQSKKEPAKKIQAVGFQTILDTVRATGARNIVVAGGIGNAYDISGVLQGFALEDKSGNGVMYSTHFYNWHGKWRKKFLEVAEKYPVLVGEFGADVKKMSFVPAKKQEDPYTWVPDAMGMLQKYDLNWTAFSLHPKATPVLIADWNFTPTPFFGVFVKDALAGKQFEMKKER